MKRRCFTNPLLRLWGAAFVLTASMLTAASAVAAPEFTFGNVLTRYRVAMVAGVVAVAAILVLVAWLLRIQRRLVRETETARQQGRRLLESEERFRRLFEDTNQPIMLAEGGRFVAANRASLAMLRLERLEQFIGRTPPEISPEFQPDGRRSAEKVEEVIATAFERGFNEFEWEHVRADGEHFIARVLLTPIRQGGKDLLHVVWSDITLQKKAEQALEDARDALERRVSERTAELAAATESLNDANERMQAILNGAGAGIMLIRDFRIEQANRRLEQLTGYGSGELDGQPTSLLYADPQEWARGRQVIYQKLSAGESYVEDQLARRKDGSTFWVRLSVSAVESGDLGKGVVGMLEDITSERSAAEALGKALEEQQAIFDAATAGIILTRDRVILRCNRTMERLFGYAPDEIIGRTTRAFYADDEAYADTSERLTSSLAEHGFFKEERELLRKDGSRFWCRKMVQAIDRQDLGKGFAGTFEDISSERAALAEMARARALAEDAARTKAEFLANMSHEIRTPMNSVMGMTHLALRADPSPKVRDYLEKIQSSGRHLLGVINDILDFSKLEADKMTLERAEFDLEKVFEVVAGVFSERTASKGLELIFDMAADVPHSLLGDALRVEQILINLASNAVKFTERGEVTVRVGVQQRVGDEVLLRFEVRDTGIGLSEEHRRRLFQSFQQADASTTRRFGGTGLGLAIAKRLVEMMSGEIGVESALGSGSTFWFTARLGVGKDTRRRRQVRPDLRGLNMLVVDDNDQARQVISEMLRGMGFSATTVETGPRALDEIDRADARGHPYDIVFLDWKMPEMDGIAVAREIHRKPLRRSPVVLMITAYDRDEVAASAGQVGVCEVLVKPVTPSALFDAVMRQLGRPSGDPAPAPERAEASLSRSEDLAGVRALLVEDNDLNQEVATEFLKALGVEVALAENGAIAVEMVRRDPYDVVLMDMQMPVMDGLAATREIRRLPQLRGLPILAMTANAMAGDRERCIDAGMNDHIAKPIDPKDLVAKLLRWVARVPLSERSGRRLRQSAPSGAPSVVPGATSATAPASPALAAASSVDAGQAAPRGDVGLDVELGLKQAMGQEPLYRNLLAKFVAGHGRDAELIAQAIGASNWQESERAAHTLKSVSAQIGAVRIRDVAERLERAIRRREDVAEIEALRLELAHRLPAVVESAAAHLRLTDGLPGGALPDDAHWPDLRRRLVALLEDDDAYSVQFFDENERVARGALGERFPELSDPIHRFDFQTALQVLGEIDRG